MKKSILLSIFIIFFCFKGNSVLPNSDDKHEETFTIIPFEEVKVSKINPTQIYAHYVPYFQSKEISGTWGVQWPMKSKNPDNVERVKVRIPGVGKIKIQKHEIAAHYYPLIGPYDSGDPHLHEYHLLLMKYSGIDGLIIDLAGAIWSWGKTHQRVEDVDSMIPCIEKVGLGFSVMYEDRFIEWGISDSVINNNEIVEIMKKDMEYFDKNYFNHKNYIKHNGMAFFSVFGPDFLNDPIRWEKVLGVINTPINFYTLWGSASKVGDDVYGEFSWPYNLNESNDSLKHLEYFHTNSEKRTMQVIFPGLKDYYFEGGWTDKLNGIGWEIDHNEGQFLNDCISMAKKLRPSHVQIATWNDIAEGTMIEPTIEIGFKYLNKIQEYAGVPYRNVELNLIYKLYQKRKEHKGKKLENMKLDQVFYYLISLQVDKAIELLNEL